jgi:Trk K+ transport system NAD-binding subunit
LIAPDASLEGNKTILIGGNKIAVLLAKRLKMHGKKAVIIEKDSERANEIRSKGIYCIEGDGRDMQVYKEVAITSADYVVVETGSSRENYKICQMLKNDMFHDKIITRSFTSIFEEKLKKLDVTTVDLTGVLATTIESLILRPTTYHALVESFESFSVQEIVIRNKEVDGMQVKDVPLHKDVILMMVKRDNSNYIPHGETYFKLGDILHVFGTDSALENTRQKMG